MNARRRDLFRPLVESLEPRRMLACEVLFRGSVLTILGDKSDNTIDVFAGRQGIHVTCDGKPSGPFQDVQAVLINSGAGQDGLRFDAEEALGAGAIKDTDGDGLPEIIDAYGGPGVDAFHVLASPTNRLTLDGGQHADTYDIQFGRLFGAVRVNDTGQAGDDRLTLLGTRFDEKIELNGGGHDGWITKWEGPDFDAAGNEVAIETIEIAHAGLELAEVETGDGDDLVTVDDRNGLLAPVPLSIRGGAGDLQGTLFIAKQQSLRDRRAYGVRLIDGGTGDDRLTVIGTEQAERFDFSPSGLGDALEVTATDIATNRRLAAVSGRDLESTLIKGEDGDDEFDFDVNEDGLVTPVDTLGGGGTDKLTIAASLLAELIEIIGVDRVAPDPLIRGTDLATGAVQFEVSAFEIEAITIDSRGGDDQIVMREQDAPLFNVDWAILTGGGNDGVQARLAGVPDVLHVQTGDGNDDVSFVFADNPNVPSPPPDQNAPPPKIMVDVGAGVDSVRLDVFGAIRPPSDLAQITPQVTLTEVLASIFITGVGLLAMQTLFPLGAIEMAQAVKDDRTGHIKSEVGIELAGPDLSLDLTTGATLDSILIGLLTQPDSQEVVKVDTGDEDDSLVIESLIGGGRQSFEIDMGNGDNSTAVRFGDGTRGRRPPTGSSVIAQYRSGSGQDDVAIDYAGPLDVDATLAALTGRGDDNVSVSVMNPAPSEGGSEPEPPAEATRRVSVAINSGDGDDEVAVDVPAALTDGLDDLIVGAGPGAGPHVKAFDAATHAEVRSFFAYPPSFAGGVRVAAGDVNGDGVADIITGAGPGAGPHVKVFDGRTHAELLSFFAYDAGFAGGIFVAAGDVNGDGRADIVTGADSGAAAHVKVFDGATGAEVRSFLAFPGFSGGVRVAAGDVNGDGLADIITGAGPGAGPHVKVFDGRTHAELASFFAYDESFAGGVFVAAGDINGDGRADVITGADADPQATGGHVKVFDGATGAEVRSFFAFPGFSGGVRVAAGDLNGDGFADIITGAGPGAGPHVKVFDGLTHAELRSFFAFDPSFSGGVFVAAGDLNNSRPPGRLDLEVEIQTGLGDDRVLSDVVSFEVQVLRRVRIDTGAGADRVNVIWAKLQNKTEFPSAAVDDFDLDMGAGDDVVRFQSDVAADELQQKVRIDGGGGADQITVLLRRLANPHLPQDAVRALIAPELTQIDIDGGSGNDRISLDFGGAILEHQAVDAVLRGGAGDDQVRARFDFAPGSTGRLSASVLGEAGNDELGLAVLNAGDLDLLFALLDGGPGRDRCRTTANVVVKNCP